MNPDSVEFIDNTDDVIVDDDVINDALRVDYE